jgi:hypothetical protein
VYTVASSKNTWACVECAHLLGKYEAATFEQAKLDSAWEMALYSNEPLSARLLYFEAELAAIRRSSARATFVQHQNAAHESVTRTPGKNACAQSLGDSRNAQENAIGELLVRQEGSPGMNT